MNNRLMEQLYQLFYQKIDILQFENWIYVNQEYLWQNLTTIEYYELCSVDYKSRFARYDLFKIIHDWIDWRSFKERRLREVMFGIIRQEEDVYENLLLAYEMWEKGYEFLEKIAFQLASYLDEYDRFILPSEESKPDFFVDIRTIVLQNAVDVIYWLNDKQIVLDNEKQIYRYDDFRPSEVLYEGGGRSNLYHYIPQDKEEKSPWWIF